MSRSFKPVTTLARFNDSGGTVLDEGFLTNGRVFAKRRRAKRHRVQARQEIIDQLEDYEEQLDDRWEEEEEDLRIMEEMMALSWYFDPDEGYDYDHARMDDYDDHDYDPWNEAYEDDRYHDFDPYAYEEYMDDYSGIGPEYFYDDWCPHCGQRKHGPHSHGENDG